MNRFVLALISSITLSLREFAVKKAGKELSSVFMSWAIKEGDMSKTIPMLCFIPVVQQFVTSVLVNENLSLTGSARAFAVRHVMRL